MHSSRSTTLAQTPIEELGSHITASVDLRVPIKYMERTRITQTSIDKDMKARCLPLERSMKFLHEIGRPYNTMIVKTSQFQFARFRFQFGSIRMYRDRPAWLRTLFIRPLHDITILTMGYKRRSSRISGSFQLAQN